MFNATAHNRLQVHMLKTYAASNLNRDDLGAPKEVFFGGTRRLRLSSQSVKRAVRISEVFDSFRAYSAKQYGASAMVRTGMVTTLLRERLSGSQEDVVTAAVRWVMTILGAKAVEKADKAKADKAKEKSAKVEAGEIDANSEEIADKEGTQLVAFSEREIGLIADAVRHLTNPKEVSGAIDKAIVERSKANAKKFSGDYSVEAQLFGRMMTATEGFAAIDSPLQVAHAMSTHEVSVQRDYWTGVDDIKIARNIPGAGMIDVRRFGAGTFYMYSCLDLDLLVSNIRTAFYGEEEATIRAIARDTAIAWLQGLALSNPTGYQNSFAAHDLPTTVAIEIGRSFPYSAAKAFEEAVSSRDEDGKSSGFEVPSIERLVEWDKSRMQAYGAFVNKLQGYGLNGLSTEPGLESLIATAGAQIDALFAAEKKAA
jgi:CRISPR system Cascade subunit CasC